MKREMKQPDCLPHSCLIQTKPLLFLRVCLLTCRTSVNLRLQQDPVSKNQLHVLTNFFTWRNADSSSISLKRSKIRFLGFLGMASTFRGPLSRQYLHYRIHKPIAVLKAAVLKAPSICQESRRTTFGYSCATYIRCAFWSWSWYRDSQVKYSRC